MLAVQNAAALRYQTWYVRTSPARDDRAAHARSTGRRRPGTATRRRRSSSCPRRHDRAARAAQAVAERARRRRRRRCVVPWKYSAELFGMPDAVQHERVGRDARRCRVAGEVRAVRVHASSRSRCRPRRVLPHGQAVPAAVAEAERRRRRRVLVEQRRAAKIGRDAARARRRCGHVALAVAPRSASSAAQRDRVVLAGGQVDPRQSRRQRRHDERVVRRVAPATRTPSLRSAARDPAGRRLHVHHSRRQRGHVYCREVFAHATASIAAQGEHEGQEPATNIQSLRPAAAGR